MIGNEQLIREMVAYKRPFITVNANSTGSMKGHGDKLTQVALCFYDYNNGSYELKDKLFMLAKPDRELINQKKKDESRSYKERAEELLKEEYLYKAKVGKLPKYALKPDFTIDDYVTRFIDEKVDELKDVPDIDSLLENQGIDVGKWLESNEGLTNEELSIGVSEFLKKYQTEDTCFVSSEAYATAHYLQKAGITQFTNDNLMDVKMVSSIANHCRGKGLDIKHFDSLTKAMLYADMVCDFTKTPLKNTSVEYLTNCVKESAMNNDDNYVMSLSAMAKANWISIDNIPDDVDYSFNSLEYVEFGNDRRYVDIDAMFEINDNFEITLEGDKEPIKTWEELENKIKALNSDISEELLSKIEEKYQEITQKANELKVESTKEVSVSKKELSFEKQLENLNMKLQLIEKAKDDIIKTQNDELTSATNKMLDSIKPLTSYVEKYGELFTPEKDTSYALYKRITNEYSQTYAWEFDIIKSDGNEGHIEHSIIFDDDTIDNSNITLAEMKYVADNIDSITKEFQDSVLNKIQNRINVEISSLYLTVRQSESQGYDMSDIKQEYDDLLSEEEEELEL